MKKAKRKKLFEKLRNNVFPVVDNKPGSQPCLTCIYEGKCDGLLDYQIISEEHILLICVMRYRDFLKRRKNQKKDGLNS